MELRIIEEADLRSAAPPHWQVRSRGSGVSDYLLDSSLSSYSRHVQLEESREESYILPGLDVPEEHHSRS